MGTLGTFDASCNPSPEDDNDLGKPVSPSLVILYSKLTLAKVGGVSNMTSFITFGCHVATFLCLGSGCQISAMLLSKAQPTTDRYRTLSRASLLAKKLQTNMEKVRRDINHTTIKRWLQTRRGQVGM